MILESKFYDSFPEDQYWWFTMHLSKLIKTEIVMRFCYTSINRQTFYTTNSPLLKALMSKFFFMVDKVLLQPSQNNNHGYLEVAAKHYMHIILSIKMLSFSVILTQMLLRFLRPHFVNLIT